MMEGYTKLFSSIVTSSVWMESDQIRIVWITMLAMSNKDGVIQASIPGLARMSGVSLPATEEALEKFLNPDQYSRTPDNDGRRIEAVEGGWRLLNHSAYRAKMNQDDQREKARLRQQRRREKLQQKDDGHACGVTPCDKSRESRHTDTDTDTKADTETSTTKSSTDSGESADGRAGNSFFKVTREEWDAYAKEIGLDDPDAPWDHYVSNGWKVSGRAPMKDWKAALRNWKRNESKFGRKPFKPESREVQEKIPIKSFLK